MDLNFEEICERNLPIFLGRVPVSVMVLVARRERPNHCQLSVVRRLVINTINVGIILVECIQL